jgi:OOP family OmpA-OmpF porin
MKNLLLVVGLTATSLACSSSSKDQENAESLSEPTQAAADENSDTFNVENIPVSTADIGDFPYFTLPEGLKSMNKPFEKKFDVCFFPLDGIMTAKEGRLYKIFVTNEPGQEFSKRYFEKSMEDYLSSVGGVKVFDGEITKEEYERYHKLDPNKGADGDMGYQGEQIKVFVIRTADQGTIYVQFSANNASGKLNVLQEEGFVQTVKKITAAEIEKDLKDKGKAILYINFDVNKATITTDGQDVVAQIAQAIKKDPSLSISIEGHTDNSGVAANNQKLSEDRAGAVLQGLVGLGCDKSRLSAKGWGAEKPLVPNNTEENKAKNRRVELVRGQ